MSLKNNCELCDDMWYAMQIPDDVASEARVLLDTLDGTPPAQAIMKVALFILQRKASLIRQRNLQSVDSDGREVEVDAMTNCPSCGELAPHFETKSIFPGIYIYRCSQGHSWSHNISLESAARDVEKTRAEAMNRSAETKEST